MSGFVNMLLYIDKIDGAKVYCICCYYQMMRSCEIVLHFNSYI